MSKERDYSKTLFLPQTDFPMRAKLSHKEPETIAKWEKEDLYSQLQNVQYELGCYELLDGPPYANGSIHLGHALNKILKDVLIRSHRGLGYRANFIPGWDCHGLPIEWKVEEEYRKKKIPKSNISPLEFRNNCRNFAEKWIGIQKEEFKRLGILADWNNSYLTMNYDFEKSVAQEIIDIANKGLLYTASKPVLWSVVEQTALAEAEVEYLPHTSSAIYVGFEIINGSEDLCGSNIAIWTTTPWTIPANRALAYSNNLKYGLYKIDNFGVDGAKIYSRKVLISDSLVDEFKEATKAEAISRIRSVSSSELSKLICRHPLSQMGYTFKVPLLFGEHVTDGSGTGFVHIAPSHGADDYKVWLNNKSYIQELGEDLTIPDLVGKDGRYKNSAYGFAGIQVVTSSGFIGIANKAVCEKLINVKQLYSQYKYDHQYPCSWRSKKPVIFISTPQWFISLDKPCLPDNKSLREVALESITKVDFVPSKDRSRLRSMVENRPDWVISRQRVWGVPLPLFQNKLDGSLLYDKDVNQRILNAFEEFGADAWYKDGASQHFLGDKYSADDFNQIKDIVDVWFDSGCAHLAAERPGKIPTDLIDVFIEGSDQHRGWFQSSLMVSSIRAQQAPYKKLITHGFILDSEGRKLSKSSGNFGKLDHIVSRYGSEIIRLWVVNGDYLTDIKVGEDMLKRQNDAYRKLRNVMRWMLGCLAHYDGYEPNFCDLSELEKYMCSRFSNVMDTVYSAYSENDLKLAFGSVFDFVNLELSAFYFDIRKDVLYCDPPSSHSRKSCLWLINKMLIAVIKSIAPVLPVTSEEVWTYYNNGQEYKSIHLEQFEKVPVEWKDKKIEEKWKKIKDVRKVVNGAIELKRAEKYLGSSLEADVTVYISTDDDLLSCLSLIDMAEVCICSGFKAQNSKAPEHVFCLDDVPGVGVLISKAKGIKCKRCWKVLSEVGQDHDYPDISKRDAQTMRELEALR